jgi:hypothetical protein
MVDTQVLVNAPSRNWKWSPAEKKVARRAFDLALDRELETVIREAKERAERIGNASDLWEMEGWLAVQRQRIDRTFDFRYSVLTRVFATLLCDGTLSEDNLRGIAQEKLEIIRNMRHV